MSRHRGAKHELLEGISLLSGVPLSVERWPSRTTDPMTVFRLCSTCQSRSRQAYAIALYERFLTVLIPSRLRFWEATAPVKLPTIQSCCRHG